jgi:hypothetical protein
LETRSNHDSPIHIEIEMGSASPTVGELDSLDRSPRSRELHPIKQRRELQMFLRGRDNRSPDRGSDCEQSLGPSKPGPCRGTTQLCHVGTAPGHRSIEVELPKSEAATEIQNRHPETTIGRYQSAPGTQHQPRLAMSGEHVKGPLKPVSTATTDEKVGQTTYSEHRPRSQIHAFVDLRLTIFPDTPEVLFEIGRAV